MGIKKAQFAVFDVLLMLLFIFSTALVFIQISGGFSLSQSNIYDESQLLEFLSNQNNFTTQIFIENLSSSNTNQNWSIISESLNFDEALLYVKIGNITESKIIFTCSPKNTLFISRDFYINNASLELRYVEFGVCK